MSCQICYEDDCAEIENADELFVAFDLTSPEADAIILSQVGDKILDLITNDREFLLILQKALGTDIVNKFEYLPATIQKYDILLDALSDTARQNVAHKTAFSLYSPVRA